MPKAAAAKAPAAAQQKVKAEPEALHVSVKLEMQLEMVGPISVPALLQRIEPWSTHYVCNQFRIIAFEWGVCNFGKDVAPGRHVMPWRPVVDPLHKK